MTTPFLGVLVTAHSKMKHLLVNMETRRSACGDNFRSGQRTEGTDTWNESGPVQCRKCAAEWEKQNGQSNLKQRSVYVESDKARVNQEVEAPYEDASL